MSVLCLITLGANIAYSAVAIIFPNKVLEHELTSIYTAIIIAGYPLAQTLFGGFITNMLNTKGKKVTLLAGVLS